ncbi:ATP-binding cassette sub-family A member 10 [Pteropus alecto]|uniref:ATP-binding cassette sub-family A member 10 n=1 Tax=Pteropus alecto TaxID=9402 RepID=L5KP76_PTEAL|nr:ATP-binding cassette sub-family A member 10 [Pteropus alecto]
MRHTASHSVSVVHTPDAPGETGQSVKPCDQQVVAVSCAVAALSEYQKGWSKAAGEVAQGEPKLDLTGQPGKPETELCSARGRTIIGTPDEETMDTVLPQSHFDMVGIVFNNTFSYKLKLSWEYRIQMIKEHFQYSEHCWALQDGIYCSLTTYWQRGFAAFQAAINAAIIEVTTNHSVMEELTSVIGINMRTLPFISRGETVNEWFIFICIVYFSPFIYFASLNVTKERKQFKKLMMVMGLRESAFWLSWGLIYAGFIFAMSIFMALIITSIQIIIITGFMVIFTLFILYGLSLITHLDYYLNGVIFPDPSGESYVMILTFFLLAFDTLLYLILTLYFERVLPDEDGHWHSPLFFLKSSFWSRHQNTHHEDFEDEISPEHSSDDSFEPVSPEFHGKEAIRIRNIKKEYNGKHGKVEALQGIYLDIYEGQVTAILGHSGAGKSTLLNILSGFSVSTEGSAAIYNTTLSEITKMEEIRKKVGFCPQCNIQFEFLTVRENLRLFAKIKGIQPKEVEQEVKRVIMELDIQNIQDVIAKKLSGGQKRKLTFGIAILGDPQVLLLDEPTAGLDPFSRHQVWNLLRERKTNHMILFSTQFMDEADILADLYNDLDKCSDQGIMNYGVSMTTLNEVFLNLKGNSAIEKPDFGIQKQEKIDVTRDTGIESEMQQALCSLPGLRTDVSNGTLWIRQVCGVAKLRFLKLTHESEVLLSLLLVLVIAFIPTIFEKIMQMIIYQIHSWELSSSMYFLSLEQLPHTPLTSLLVINNTDSDIEDFIQSLKHQDIVLDIDDFRNRNGSDDPSYNGAIIVSGDQKDYRFSVACNTKRMNCFPVLMGIVSNALLGIFNYTELIKTERSTFPVDDLVLRHGFLGVPLLMLLFANCISPYIGMSSISDYKLKAQSQLWISGLCPSAYWCGQALVDIPLYSLILLSIYFIYCFMVFELRLSLGLIFALPYLQSAIFLFIIRCLEMKYGKETMKKDPVFRISPRSRENRPNPEEPEEEDEDVQTERVKTANALTSANSEEVVSQGCTASLGKQKDDISTFLGYCPQENSLWPSLTVKDHLELYAAVKGLGKDDAALSISRLVGALQLQDQQKRPVKALSEGIKRKLCFALSILGNPPVVLLDEPSTGMDPEGQQRMWQAIQTIVKNTGRGALLTTHHMAEAEAVCDRVAIMVSGRLRQVFFLSTLLSLLWTMCIGSIQHLKSKFGKDYLLEVKIKEPTQTELLHTEILKLFPQAARQERYSSMMAYKLPVEDVHPLSQAFFKLEAVKQTFDLEEYSLSQATLEQVFLELSKEQEMGNFDDEVDTTVKWKLLPQEEP